MTDQASGRGPASTPVLFSAATAVRPQPAGIFDAEVSGDWTVVGRPNGGYLLALLGRAARSLTGSGHVVAASAHYLRPPAPGPVRIEGELLRRGRSVTQVRMRMCQGGQPCVEALMSASELDPSEPPRWDAGVPVVEHLPFDECVRLEPVTPDGAPVPLFEQVELRLEPGSTGGLTAGRPSGRGELRGWLRLLGDEEFDPLSLLYAVDTFPPSTFDTAFQGMVSTVELTAYVRAVPAPGPVRIVSRARLIDRQYVDETCDIWDQTGRLVAHATQLARMPLG